MTTWRAASITWRLMISAIIILAFSNSDAVSASSDEPYKLGPEDTITVSVVRHAEFSGDFLVPIDGVIDLPGAGQVQVTGKTAGELSADIAERLRDRLREPEVAVTVKTPRMRRVHVLGDVDKPGAYDIKPGWRITEVMAAAGGLVKQVDASDCTATVLRASAGRRETVKLTDVLSGLSEANLPVESGDVLTIEAQETIPVYVVGKVRTAGLYRLRANGAGVMEALAMAGGATEEAALSRVRITRLDGSSEVVNLVVSTMHGESGPNPRLKSGDLVTVPEETSRVAILGHVKEPGFYAMRDGQRLTLADGLGLARGVEDKRSNIRQVAIIRYKEGKQERQVFDLARFLKSGDVKQNPELIPGDVVYVPGKGGVDWDSVLRSLTSIGVLLNPLVN